MDWNKGPCSRLAFHSYRRGIPAAILVLAICSTSVAQVSGRRPSTLQSKFDGYVIVNEYYDDNVFDYSGNDRTLMDTSATVPGRFAIDHVGDYVTDAALRLDRLWEHGRRSSWRLRLRYDADIYARNTFRNYHQFGVEFRHEARRTYFETGFRWLPKYYLRDLYWRPMPERPAGVNHAPANFTKYAFNLEAGTQLARHLQGRTWLAIDRHDYDFPFDERDNTSYSAGVRVDSRLTRRISGQLRFELGTSKAAGADSTSPTVVDVSYHSRAAAAELELRIDRTRNIDLTQSFRYEHQSYTTDRITDVYHYGRKDDEYEWETQLTWRPHPHWQPRLFYAYRRGTTTTSPGATDVGAFSGNRAGLQLIHYF